MLAMIDRCQNTQCITACCVWGYVAADLSECSCCPWLKCLQWTHEHQNLDHGAVEEGDLMWCIMFSYRSCGWLGGCQPVQGVWCSEQCSDGKPWIQTLNWKNPNGHNKADCCSYSYHHHVNFVVIIVLQWQYNFKLSNPERLLIGTENRPEIVMSLWTVSVFCHLIWTYWRHYSPWG